MLQLHKLDQVIPHMNGQLTKGYPRKIVVQQNIDELREKGVSLLCAWSVRFEVPMDMSCDCDKTMAWLTNRFIEYKSAGFKLIELSAELRETKRDRDSKEVGTWEPYWTGMFVHPQRKDPRTVVKDCRHYQFKP